MTYTDFDRIISEYGIGRTGGYNGFILTFKDVAFGSLHFTKKINRSILWLSNFSEILNHIKEEDLRERLETKIKQIKENIQKERIKSLDKDFNDLP